MPIESAINCAAANPEIPHFDVVGIDLAAIDVPTACKIIAGVALTHVPASLWFHVLLAFFFYRGC